MRHSW